MVGDTLHASCQTLKDTWQNTSMPALNVCLNSITRNGDIANIDGNLLCMPDLPKVHGAASFPMPETQLNEWIYSSRNSELYRHSWDIWAGLNHVVGTVNKVPVRAFETWSTPTLMLYQINSGKMLQANASTAKHSTVGALPALELQQPHQFLNITPRLKAAAPDQANVGDTKIFVSVAYNPPAAQHAVNNKLFLQKTLDQYVKNGYTEVPNFPSNAITIKPVYKHISAQKYANKLYVMPGWPGTPSPAKAFLEQDWGSCVYINIKGSGQGGNSIDQGCKGPNTSNTFYLNNFIHHQLTAEEAKVVQKQITGREVVSGDYIILVGMHVTTREIKRWAWQTYWWSANSDQPYLPSNAEIAAFRKQSPLDPAANHYAMAVAYQMVQPAQPITGGQNTGSSLIAYNPHLEAGFDPGVFQSCASVGGAYAAPSDTNCNKPDPSINRYGVQSNCMTCHNMAMYNPKTNYKDKANRQKPYATDFYMSLQDKAFDGSLKLDFAWSLLGYMQDDSK
ncbi:hypothetical protein C2134_19050 [Chromobacterium sinusclupearum]|uniref:Uncharacterized protein n=2 Tax=Chromobacterium sinusclupearum TaxID=2077146 RepID=A0A2K4MIZ4_9NEIS|nr:hypothetical protein C2134_19050 [Chromobacterium sinusclupearum]